MKLLLFTIALSALAYTQVVSSGLWSMPAAFWAEYKEPKLDIAKDEELRVYIDRRSREILSVDALNDKY